MDAIEASRLRAASLHAAALARGADPWKPLDFVMGEVALAGFAAEPIEAGATQLGNAQARFNPELGLILFSDVGSDFDRAFLIAHELGHALLGDAEGTCDPDQERSSEPAPEGEERIIAHGPRQRREVQMDLFARELLLPRPFMRRLHLDEQMTGSEIARRMGAPLGAVYQQLFDALLLPEFVEVPKTGKPKPLNDRQRKAAEHRGGAYLLEAGPGTGKTQTLTARVADLLAEGVDPRRILVLTFSNRAAGELTDRIAGAQGDALAALWIGTFHGFGLDVLHTFGDLIGRSRKPTLLDRAGAVALLEDELPRLGFTHHRDLYDPTTIVSDMLNAVSRAQDEMCDHVRYAELAAAMCAAADALVGDEREAAVERAARAQEVGAFYAHYERLKADRSLVDFGDLVMLAVRLLEEEDAAKAYYRGRFKYVLVDEYQDVNRASVRMLKALSPDGHGLWAVGDARQSIYRFRGASSRNMALFGRDFPGAEDGDLVINYRSSKEVVDLFLHFGGGMSRVRGEGDPEIRAYELLHANRGSVGVEPDLILAGDKFSLSPIIADEIAADLAQGGRFRDHCVLVSGNDRLAAIGRELEALEIPVLFLGSLFERPEVKELLCLLSLITDPWAAGLVRVACMPEFQMDLAQVIEVMGSLRDRPEHGPNALLDPEVAATLAPTAAGALRSLAETLAGFGFESDPWFTLAGILLDRTRIAARFAAGLEPAERTRAIAVWQFMNFVKAVRDREKPAIPALLRRVRRLLRLGDDRDLRHLPSAAAGIDAVRLMTIHGAKGLEFRVVHLPGLNADTLPKAPHLGRPACPPPDGMIEFARGTVTEELAISHDEEQDCLLYVAMSRAEDRLHLYRCTVQKNGTTPRHESSFVARLGTGLVSRSVSSSRKLPPAPDAAAVPVTFSGPVRIAAWRLAAYRKCPRRFLYMQVLRTGGATDKTPYRLVHDIVRRICRDISAMPATPAPDELERMARTACEVPALIEHGYYADFAQLAVDLVGFYGDERRSLSIAADGAVDLSYDQHVVEIEAHDILSEDGGQLIWLVQTGHARKSSEEAIDVRALVGASAKMTNTTPQILYLADRQRLTVVPKRGAETNLQRMVGEVMAGIRAGAFPKTDNEGPRTCGNCPALMICDALPENSSAIEI